MQTAYQTDVGRQRQENQDRVNFYQRDPDRQLAIIADGIGGSRGGNVAAEMVIQALGHYFQYNPPATPATTKAWFQLAVAAVNRSILNRAQEETLYQRMGTTMVAAIFFGHQVVIANIGDSRAYIFHQDLLTQVTADHSLVNELVKTGGLTEQEAARSPQKNIITRAIGINQTAKVDVNEFTLGPGDQLLLCTDGLSKLVSTAAIAATLKQPCNPATKCQQLINQANAAGGNDNITVLICVADQEN